MKWKLLDGESFKRGTRIQNLLCIHYTTEGKLNEKNIEIERKVFFFCLLAVARWKEKILKKQRQKKFFYSLFLFNLAGLLLVLIVRCRGWCCVCYFIEHIINIISIILWRIFFNIKRFVFVSFLYIFSLQLMFLRFSLFSPISAEEPKHLLAFSFT